MSLTSFSVRFLRGVSIASFFGLATLSIAGHTSGLANASVATDASKDDILAWGDAKVWEAEAQAVAAELERGRAGLRLDNSPAPYYLRMDWVRAQDWLINASYGGVTHHIFQPSAFGRVSVRVGDHQHDNGNFYSGGAAGGAELSLSPEAGLTRHAIWLAMDEAYRQAVADYSAKESAKRRLSREEVPINDWTVPSELISNRSWSDAAAEKLSQEWSSHFVDASYAQSIAQIVRELSASFVEFPGIENGDVYFVAQRSRRVSVSTEAWTQGEDTLRWSLIVVADTHAPDGMNIDHGAVMHGVGTLPSPVELRERGLAMVETTLSELSQLSLAPALDEDYDGPVLLAPLAAAQMLSVTAAVHLTGVPAPLSDYGPLLELQPRWIDAIGKKVMADFVDLVDDPTGDGFSSYPVDSDGVAAAPVDLISQGIVRELLMTRVPNRHRNASLGRNRMTAVLGGGPSISHLQLRARRQKQSERALQRDVLRRAEDDGYEFAYVLESMRDATILGDVPRDTADQYGSSNKVQLPLPGRLYRIDRQGKKTLVRGALLSPMSLRALRRIRAVGKESKRQRFRLAPGLNGGIATPIGPRRLMDNTVDVEISTPAWILDGLELIVERGQQERLPRLSHPFAEPATQRRVPEPK